VNWSLDNKPDHSAGDRTRTELLFFLSNYFPPFPAETLGLLLRKGFNPNASYEGVRDGFSPWQYFVACALAGHDEEPHSSAWMMTEIFLKENVDADFQLRCYTCQYREDPTYWSTTVTQGDIYRVLGFNNDHDEPWLIHVTGETYPDETDSVEVVVPVVSLRECVEYCKPDNEAELLRLIDRNMEIRRGLNGDGHSSEEVKLEDVEDVKSSNQHGHQSEDEATSGTDEPRIPGMWKATGTEVRNTCRVS
jgi:hypothetical protein